MTTLLEEEARLLALRQGCAAARCTSGCTDGSDTPAHETLSTRLICLAALLWSGFASAGVVAVLIHLFA